MYAYALVSLMKEKSGDLKSFARESGINYNTLYYSTRTDERVDKMPIGNFIAIAHALDMTADELFAHLGNLSHEDDETTEGA